MNLRRRVALCVPASLAGQDPAAPERESWLQAHRWKRSAGEIPFRRLSGIAVENALGTSRIDIKKPDLGMVPAVLDLQEGGSSAVSSSVGNFSCYRISLDRGAPRVPAVRDLEVQDAFGTYRLDLSRPTRACSPADVNGLSPQAPGHPDRLVCYRVRRTRGASLRPSSEVASLDLLGAAEATVTRPTELCLPSWLGSLAP